MANTMIKITNPKVLHPDGTLQVGTVPEASLPFWREKGWEKAKAADGDKARKAASDK